jgi:hypothetical protein
MSLEHVVYYLLTSKDTTTSIKTESSVRDSPITTGFLYDARRSIVYHMLADGLLP